jgi:ATP-binding cassette subfamily B protein
MKILKDNSKEILGLFILFLLNIFIQIFLPQVLSYFIDSIELKKSLQFLSLIIIIYFFTNIVKILLGLYEEYFSKKLGFKITNNYRKKVMETYLNYDYQNYERFSNGEIITRLDEDVEGLYNYYYTLIYKILSSVVLMIGALIVLANKNIVMAIALTIVSIITIIFFKKVQDYGVKQSVKKNKIISEYNGFIKEHIDNSIEIHTSSIENYSIEKMNNLIEINYKKCMPASFNYANLWSAATLMETITTIVSLAFAFYLWYIGNISFGVVYLIYSYIDLIFDPLQNFRNYLNKLQDYKAKIIRVDELLTLKNHVKSGHKILEDINSIEIQNLSFGYEEEEVLKKINLKINKNEHIGIIGQTGSGKSTLVKLIARFYEYDVGDILINNESIRHYSLNNLRENIIFCSQQVEIIHGTLRDNITFYNDSISDNKIIDAINYIGLNNWYEKFEKGLDTNLELGENNISSGEAQIISIIRIFIKNPKLIILDEISSKIDTVTEKLIIDAINVIAENKIVISIAHKLTALKQIDRIIVLKNGQIIENDTFDNANSNTDSEYNRLKKILTQKGGEQHEK